MKIAVIGSGVSGLTCAYKLYKKHDIKVFEENNYIGGHANTLTINSEDGPLNIDTGFIVFNKKTYPIFTQILDELGVFYQNTSMSFSVKCDFEQWKTKTFLLSLLNC